MGIFSRGRRSDAEARDGGDVGAVTGNTAADATEADAGEVVNASDVAIDPSTDPSTDSSTDSSTEEAYSRVRGPFDASEVDDERERIDLGSLLVPPFEGMQLRLELDQEQQTVVSAHALIGDSGVQLQAFAAPRTLPVWPEIRSEIAESVLSQGGSAEVVDGPLGRELVAGIPSRGADGRTVHAAVRFLGVDGPRWFLRAVISGPAAQDEAKAAPLVELVRSVVVVRDDEARPPREALPLRVPSVEEQEPQEADPATGGDTEPAEPTARSADDLKPFERGPEITEVR